MPRKPKNRKLKHPAQAKQARQKVRFLFAYAKLRGIVTAAEHIGVSRNTVWEWRTMDKEFNEAVSSILEKDTEQLEVIARKRASDKSDNLMMFLLKGRRPTTYRDNSKVELTGEDGKPLTVELVNYAKPKKGGKTNERTS